MRERTSHVHARDEARLPRLEASPAASLRLAGGGDDVPRRRDHHAAAVDSEDNTIVGDALWGALLQSGDAKRLAAEKEGVTVESGDAVLTCVTIDDVHSTAFWF